MSSWWGARRSRVHGLLSVGMVGSRDDLARVLGMWPEEVGIHLRRLLRDGVVVRWSSWSRSWVWGIRMDRAPVPLTMRTVDQARDWFAALRREGEGSDPVAEGSMAGRWRQMSEQERAAAVELVEQSLAGLVMRNDDTQPMG